MPPRPPTRAAGRATLLYPEPTSTIRSWNSGGLRTRILMRWPVYRQRLRRPSIQPLKLKLRARRTLSNISAFKVARRAECAPAIRLCNRQWRLADDHGPRSYPWGAPQSPPGGVAPLAVSAVRWMFYPGCAASASICRRLPLYSPRHLLCWPTFMLTHAAVSLLLVSTKPTALQPPQMTLAYSLPAASPGCRHSPLPSISWRHLRTVAVPALNVRQGCNMLRSSHTAMGQEPPIASRHLLVLYPGR